MKPTPVLARSTAGAKAFPLGHTPEFQREVFEVAHIYRLPAPIGQIDAFPVLRRRNQHLVVLVLSLVGLESTWNPRYLRGRGFDTPLGQRLELTMDSMTAREFYDRFTRPAIEYWQNHQDIEHLAAHTLSQLAILADVAASHVDDKSYRKDLEARHPVLKTIRDAHNSHKHGWPGGRNDRTSFLQGQRVAEAIGAGFFADISFVDGPPTTHRFMGIENGGIEAENVGILILDGLLAWQEELSFQGTRPDQSSQDPDHA